MARVFARTTFLSDNRDDLQRVSVPTLIVECARDTLAPREVGSYVNRQIGGSALVTLEVSGHCPHVSAPTDTAAAIADFAEAALGQPRPTTWGTTAPSSTTSTGTPPAGCLR
jgi:sigma-B regulation protein RsbQ